MRVGSDREAPSRAIASPCGRARRRDAPRLVPGESPCDAGARGLASRRRSRAIAAGSRRPMRGATRQLEGDHGALSVLPPPGLAGRRLADVRRRLDHPSPPPVPPVQPAVHDGRDREPVGRQALGRHRAVQPREDRRRRPQGVPGPSGERGRPRAARPEGRGDAARRRARPRSTRTRSGSRSSARCASSTRSPTCGSRASTRRSTPSRTSRRRSPCCARSTSRRAGRDADEPRRDRRGEDVRTS